MYFHSPCLLGDMSSSQNLDTASVDERILAIMETQDPMIVDDLRHHNRGQPSKYEQFWEETRKYLEEEVETAVDERRYVVQSFYHKKGQPGTNCKRRFLKCFLHKITIY